MKYNYEYLINFSNENNIKLCDKYNEFQKLNSESLIECFCNNCKENVFSKKFRYFILNFFCKKCNLKKINLLDKPDKEKKIRYNYNFLIDYCNKNNIILNEKYKEFEKINCNSMIDGKCINQNCNNYFSKKFKLLLNNVYCNNCNQNLSVNYENNKIKNKQVKRYDYNFLIKYCNINNIILSDNYSDYQLINRDTIIKGNCTNQKCNNFFSKSFRCLFKNNSFCKVCSIKEGVNNFKKTFLNKYNCESPLQNNDIKEKIKKTNLIKYNCENPFQNESIKEKIKKTNLNKYGFEFVTQNNDIKEKIKKTNLKKYGFEFASQNNDIKNKMIYTNLKKYGFEYTQQSKAIREKSYKTNIIKYGNKMTLLNKDINKKSRETCLKKYGFEYASQNPDILNKILHIKTKNYILPSKNIIRIQGYENLALDILLKKYNEEDIITGKKLMPTIYYEYKKYKHIYYPDIYIKKDNLIIEVKSIYTYNRELIKNILKAYSTRKLGYNFEIWIFDKNKKLLII